MTPETAARLGFFAGALGMELGLPEHRDWERQRLLWLLALPFK